MQLKILKKMLQYCLNTLIVLYTTQYMWKTVKQCVCNFTSVQNNFISHLDYYINFTEKHANVRSFEPLLWAYLLFC